jgi:hypothetical protein
VSGYIYIYIYNASARRCTSARDEPTLPRSSNNNACNGDGFMLGFPCKISAAGIMNFDIGRFSHLAREEDKKIFEMDFGFGFEFFFQF